MLTTFHHGEGIIVATGQDVVQLTFEQRGVEIYLAPSVANGLGETLQRAAAMLGVMPIGGRRTAADHARFIRELERLYLKYHEEEDAT